MAEISGFYNSINGDRKYKADFFAEYFASFIGNGVYPNPTANCQAAAAGDMTVTLRPGKAWINGYYYHNTDNLILTLDMADGVLSRVDRVVLRYSTIDRSISAKIKKGTFASNPTAPALQRDADIYELGIADIYVAAGAVSIIQANITDLRPNSNYCGIVAGVIDQIDGTDLFAQYDSIFNTFYDGVKDTLSGDVAGNLMVKIDGLIVMSETEPIEPMENSYWYKVL